MEGCAEKTIKPIRNTTRNDRASTNKCFHLSGLLSEVIYFSALCASLFFPKTRPPAQGVENNVSRSWGLASLMHALKTQCAIKKKQAGVYSPLVGRKTSTRGRASPAAEGTEKAAKTGDI